jgi:hypothetical protein
VVSGSVFSDGGFQLTGTGTLNFTSGTFKLGAAASATTFPDFATTNISAETTVEYAATAAQSIKGISYSNLTISGSGTNAKTASADITVNGILNLSSANASATQGCLIMSTFTLNMGAASTTTGAGDVTGIVKRTQTFDNNTPYSFGNQYTTITFLGVSGGTKPAWISCKIAIGAAPTWKTGAIQRVYSFAQDATATDQVVASLHYLDTELNTNTESKLVLWDAHAGPGFGTIHEHGKTSNDVSGNTVTLSGKTITYLAPTTVLDNKQWSLADYASVKNTWLGIDTDWSNISNWSAGHVPLTTEEVLIPGSLSSYPTLTLGVAIKTLEIASGASLSAGSNSITINGSTGAWLNNSTFNGNTGTVVFSNGTISNVVSLGGSGINNFYNITVNANTYLQPASGAYLKIAGAVTAGSGSIIDLKATNNSIEYNGSVQTILNPQGPSSDVGYSSLIINSSGTTTFPATLNVMRDFTLTAGTTAPASSPSAIDILGNVTLTSGTFTTSGYAVSVGGNWTNNGATFTPGTSTVTFNNTTVVQAINGTAASQTFYNLVVAKTAQTLNIGGSTASLTVNNFTQTTGNFKAPATLNINGSATLTGGTFTAGAIINLSGNWTNNGATFDNADGTVNYSGSSAQTIGGSATNTFNNLTVNNSAGVTASASQTVNGVLYLQSSNVSATQGTLETEANTIFMGAAATTTGTGDVTGIVTRNYFELNTPYSFGNQFTTVNFTIDPLPTSLSEKIVLTSTHTWKTDAIHRYYDIIRIGGSSATRLTLNLHYLDAELNGTTETNLNFFDNLYPSTVVDRGHSNQSSSDNWLGLSGLGLPYVASTAYDYKYWTMGANSVGNTHTWISGGAVLTDWTLPGNWNGGVPDAEANVVIPAITIDGTHNNPTLPANTTLNSIDILTGGIVNATTGSPMLTITGGTGAWNNLGTLNAGSSTIIFTNAAATMADPTNFYNVTIADGATLTLGTDNIMRISGTLSLSNSGVLNAASNHNTIEFNGTDQTIVFPNGSTPGYHNLILSGSGTKTMPAFPLQILGDLRLNGTASAMASHDISVTGNVIIGTGTTLNGSSNVISTSGNWSNSGTFTAAAGTVIFNGESAQTITGATTFNNLTINGAGGVTAASNITVNSVLDLSSANPSSTKGLLELVSSWGTWPTAYDLTSSILTMGTSATTTGQGDVTGKILRNAPSANTSYTFGNEYTSVAFINPTTSPSSVTVVVRIGTTNSKKADAVQRMYEITPASNGAGGTVSANFHYLDSELQSNTETKLTTWDYDLGTGGAASPDEHGRSSSDYSNNFVGMSNVPMEYFIYVNPTHQWRTIFTIGDFAADHLTWNGSTSTAWTGVSGNWTPAGTPSEWTHIIIPDASTTLNDPNLPEGISQIKTLIIEAGGVLVMGANTLEIHNAVGGGWEDQNAAGNDPGTSKVVFVNSGASISGNSRFYNVDIATGADITNEAGSTMKIGNLMTKTGTGKWYADVFGATIQYNGGAQTILLPDGSPDYHNLILSGSGVKTMPDAAISMHGNFILSGTASVTAGGALTIGGNMELGSGTAFTAGSFTHNSAGNLENNGATFTTTGSTFNFNGAELQTIGGTSASTFGNITLNNSSGASLGSSTTVGGILTLTSGILSTNANTLIVSNTATNAISGGSSSGYINGNLRRGILTGTNTYSYPVGTSTGYTPVSVALTGVSTGGNLTITSNDGASSNYPSYLNSTKKLNRYYTITDGGIGTFSADASFTYLTADLAGGAVSGNMKAYKYNGSYAYPGTVTGSNVFTATGITAFSEVGAGEEYSADLSNIVLSGSPGGYTFASGTYEYTGVTVGNAASSITVTPTGAGVITVNGTEVATGVASGDISLTAGAPTVITVVATETGKSAKTYIISITRNNAPQTTPTFNPDAGAIAWGTPVAITSSGASAVYYTTNGDVPTTGSTLYSTPLDINSAITLKALALRTGYDNSEIASASYTQAATTALSDITISGTPASYTFASGTYEYAGVTLANSVSSITVTPTGAGVITVNGTIVASESASGAISLTENTEKTITVIATEEGKIAKTYTIKVTRNGTQASPTFSLAAGAVAYGSTVTITSAGATNIFYTTDGTEPATSVTGTTLAYADALTIDVAKTVKAIAVKTDWANSAVVSATYTQASATPPSAVVLSVGSTAPVGGVNNVVIPAAGAADETGAISGWVTSSNDKIKFTVTDNGGTSAITIDAIGYTSGNDYVILSTASLTIVVTTTESGKITGVRTFTVSVTASPVQATPTFSPAAGAILWGTTVTISSASADAIYYTTDGSTPTISSTNQATIPLVISSAVTVKALAVKSGYTNSAIATAAYTQSASADLTGIALSGSPAGYSYSSDTYSYSGLTVPNNVASITVTPTGAGVITVDGTVVTSGNPSGAISLSETVEKTITVVATETNKSSRTYTIKVTRNGTLATPTFNPVAGAIALGATVSIASSGATAIYYTTNGDVPTTGSTLYEAPVAIISALTLKALAVKAGYDNSEIGSAAYTQSASANLTGIALSGSPSGYSFASGTYGYTGLTVANAISSITVTPTGAGVIIVDGTVVATGVASGAIDLTALTEKTITIIATEEGKSEKTYTIKVTRNGALPTPNFSPVAGAIAFGTPVTISSSGATAIYYTTDGTDPTTEKTLYSTPVAINSAQTLRALAVKPGYDNSAIGSAVYTQAASADLPGIALSGSPTGYSFSSGTYVYTGVTVGNSASVTVTPTGDGTITVEGTEVATGSASDVISLPAGTPAVITVIATETGKSAKTYTISITRNNAPQATPTFNPDAGAVALGTTVAITSSGATTIYYTTNGADPTTGSSVYSTPVAINSVLTLKALAVKAGYDNSDIGSADYTLVLHHFAISTISSPQIAGSAITGIEITAQDANNNTVTDFTGTVDFSGTAGITGTSTAFTSGQLSGVRLTPPVKGTSLTLVVTGSTKTGTSTFDVNAPVMGGTVTITGTARYGGVLTAVISSITYTPTTNLDVPAYQWKRGETNIGTNSSTYTLVEADITNTITVIVSADGAHATGSVTSSATGTIAKAVGPAAPTGVAKTDVTAYGLNNGTLTGTASGQEYEKDASGSWVAISGTTVTGLAPGSYIVRVAVTSTALAGTPTSAFVISEGGLTADLTGIALSGSPSGYSFASGTYSYSGLTVANAVSNITVTPTGAGVITVEGTTVTSGSASEAIALTALTEKTITVIATEEGKGAKTYTIKVTRNGALTTPAFSPVAGAIVLGTTVTITSAGADHIYYTTNGDDPTTGSSEYSTAVAINSALTLKALAVKAGYDNSAIGSAAYTVVNLPQGSLTANGPFCATGAGELTWTATAGTGPYTVIYNDGTSDRTANSVVSGTSFATFTTPVTTTTTYTLVSVTGAVSSVRSNSFTGSSATITINALPTVADIAGGADIVDINSVTPAFTNTTSGGVWSIVPVTGTASITSGGVVTGLTSGTVTVTYTVTDGCSKSVTHSLTVSETTGIKEQHINSELKLANYPNPFEDNTKISYSLPFDGRVTLVLSNVSGQVVKTIINATQTAGDYNINISFADLNSGIYHATMRLKGNGEEMIKNIRLVKGR